MSARRLTRFATALGALLAITGCGDLLQEPESGTGQLPVRLEQVSGSGQAGPPGAPLAEPLRVQLLDPDGAPRPRLWVEWTVIGGSGHVAPRHAFTDEQGIAETTWTLGSQAGPQQVRAFVNGGGAMVFEATAVSP